MRRLGQIFIITTAILSVLTATAIADEPRTYYIATSSTSEVNIRSEPTTQARILTTMTRGTTITATGERRGLWVQLQFDETTTYHDGTRTTETLEGWVLLSLLSLEEPYTNRTGTIVADGRVRLRDNPSGAFLRWVQPGEAVEVLSVVEFDGSRWYRVRYAGEKGFVDGEYLELA